MDIYEDKRGWRYRVQDGIGGDCWKVFYQKPDHKGKETGWHGSRMSSYTGDRKLVEDALEVMAAMKGWKLVSKNS